MLRAWAEGRPLFGIWLTMPNVVGAEFAAREGPDYVCVDTQHGLIDFSDTVPMLVGITAGGAIPVVRVTWGGIAHVEDIVSVPGVDAVYIGPSDLALAVGKKPGPRPYDDLAEPVAQIKAACRKHGVALGVHSLTGEAAGHWAEAGFDMITVGSDASMFAAAVRSYLETARQGLSRRESGEDPATRGR